MSLITKIGSVTFPKMIKKDQWVRVCPESLDSSHLALKSRYHLTQALACLLELKRRKIDVCGLLTSKQMLFKNFGIKHDKNSLKMFVSVQGESKRSK